MAEKPRQPPRLGPRPLALHLATTCSALASSLIALPILSAGFPSSKLPSDLTDAARTLAAAGSEGERALARQALARLDAVLAGILAYRRSPHRRPPQAQPPIWTEADSRIHAMGPPGGPPLFFVPSLVNRAYVLDLCEDVSLVRWLVAQSYRVYLLEWGVPGEAEARFTFDDYVGGRLSRALDAVCDDSGRPPVVIGYCMGGMLALALARLKVRAVSALVFLATPWDFHAGNVATAKGLARWAGVMTPVIRAWGALPVDVLQSLFLMLDPLLAARKFEGFGRLDSDSTEARLFVSLEDWLNDGVPLAAEIAIECLTSWYGANDPAGGRWCVAGHAITPEAWSGPSLHLIPQRDRIVPPESARALSRAMPGADVLEPPLGHIGMAASRRAEGLAWRGMHDWLQTLR